MKNIIVIRFLAVIVLLFTALGTAGRADAAERQDSIGKEFWIAFPTNYTGDATLSLFVSGGVATTGTVAIPGVGFSQDFAVTPGAVTTVSIPASAQASGYGVVESKGIHVTAGAEVSVYGLNRIQYTTDAYLGLPVDVLGSEYRAMGYANLYSYPSEYMIVATRNSTHVTAPAFNDCPAVDVTLDQGQTYQVGCSDVTGVPISATAPIALYGGAQCTNIPPGYYACDHVVEELPPLSAWGKKFLTVPLATRLRGDTFRVLAQANGTEVRINGATVATLSAGEFYEGIIDGQGVIEASAPVLVAQYSNGSSYDGVVSDPFMMLIPPFEQYLNSYTVTTPADGFSRNFINVVAPNRALNSLTLDGAAIPLASFTAIGSSGFSGAQLEVALGSHSLGSSFPFGVFVYGFADYDSYGYPGGLSLSPVAFVSTLTLSPDRATRSLGGQQCLTATVADQNRAPLGGIRVDVSVSGADAQSGFVTTSSAGTADYCYAGMVTGDDTVVASVGDLSATSVVTWTARATALQVVPTTLLSLSPLAVDAKLNPKARLSTVDPAAPLAGKLITFTTKETSLVAGRQTVELCSAITDSAGLASCSAVMLKSRLAALVSKDLGLTIVGNFAGETGLKAATAEGRVLAIGLGGN